MIPVPTPHTHDPSAWECPTTFDLVINALLISFVYYTMPPALLFPKQNLLIAVMLTIMSVLWAGMVFKKIFTIKNLE